MMAKIIIELTTMKDMSAITSEQVLLWAKQIKA